LSNRAIAQLAALFTLLFAILAIAQLRLQVFEGPKLGSSALNPRRATAAEGRGEILASDGTVLAESKGSRRLYPEGALLAQAVGYVSPRYGVAGLEASFDRFLSAPVAASDPLAQLRAIFDPTSRKLSGARLVTTIDLRTQRALVGALSRYPRAAGIVLEPSSGEVLALASIPSFDPNELDAIFPRLAHDARSPLLDRSTAGLYPPGSTFKIFTAATALEFGVVTLESTFVDDGQLVIGNYTVHDDEGEATGTQDLAGAFALSSNVDFAQIALRIGVDRWFDAASRWTLGQPIAFDLPAERDRLPARADVLPGVLAQLGFGQADLLVTPLRMALIGATIATGGTTPRPILVREIDTGDHRVVTPHGSLAVPISAETAGQVRDLMIGVVQRGTGTAAALPNVRVAGKTGTATNPAGRAHAWFVAFAPAEAPRVAVAIVVENAGYGGAVAAPIARNVLRVALAHGLH
jgi:penicillin-binding protein A